MKCTKNHMKSISSKITGTKAAYIVFNGNSLHVWVKKYRKVCEIRNKKKKKNKNKKQKNHIGKLF